MITGNATAIWMIAITSGRKNTIRIWLRIELLTSRLLKLLVSTTVIEVGIDVPNAVVILIENAEQFGLSQLHQLRGRVGRGSEQSFCVLMTDNRSDYTKARMDAMVRTTNGFEIAQAMNIVS